VPNGGRRELSDGGPVEAAVGSPAAPVVLAEAAAPSQRADDPAATPSPEPTAEPAAPPVTASGLPARSRKRQPALEGPTVPSGLSTVDAPPAGARPPGDRPAGPPAEAGSGLPVRVRQASVAPELRDDPSAVDTDQDDDVVRPPEQVRRLMSSYQSGTRRGRTDAARLLGGAHDADEPDAGDGQAT
jgi:hypothetical protein